MKLLINSTTTFSQFNFGEKKRDGYLLDTVYNVLSIWYISLEKNKGQKTKQRPLIHLKELIEQRDEPVCTEPYTNYKYEFKILTIFRKEKHKYLN